MIINSNAQYLINIKELIDQLQYYNYYYFFSLNFKYYVIIC